MKVIGLQSGSNGNCIYVESGDVRLLFDAGISGRRAQSRLAEHGRCIKEVDGVVISHDHRDHTCCMGVLQRKFNLPIHVTELTLAAAQANFKLGALADLRFFNSGSIVQFGHVSVETIPTPHDAADGVAFIVDDGEHRFGILTDLGHVFDRLRSVLSTLDAVLIESNYDDEMLERGYYPDFLKRRIRGPHGHLSNTDAAELLAESSSPRLKWACLAHLSQDNNHPNVALATHRRILGSRFPLFIAERYSATPVLEM